MESQVSQILGKLSAVLSAAAFTALATLISAALMPWLDTGKPVNLTPTGFLVFSAVGSLSGIGLGFVIVMVSDSTPLRHPSGFCHALPLR
jgi:hypothetical protein